MDLKCVECGKDAEFTFEGTSLCMEHLPKELKLKIARKKNKGAINTPLYTAP